MEHRTMYNEYTQQKHKKNLLRKWSWGKSSVSQVFAMQAQSPEFDLRAHVKSQMWWQSQDYGGKYRVSLRSTLVSRKQKVDSTQRMTSHSNMHMHVCLPACMCVCMHTSTRTHSHIHKGRIFKIAYTIFLINIQKAELPPVLG